MNPTAAKICKTLWRCGISLAVLFILAGVAWLVFYSYVGVQSYNVNTVRLYNRQTDIFNGMSDLVENQREINRRLDRLQVGSEPPAEGFGAAEPKGGRIIPRIRDLAEEAQQAAIDSRDLMRKVSNTIDDFEAGRKVVKIRGGVFAGEHTVSVEQQ